MPLSFGVTFDYRCPFARNGHEHLVEGLKGGADWELEGSVVERGAAIGSGAVILAGVRIGAGALVGAGAVVRHDVAAGETVAGNPARALAPRA